MKTKLLMAMALLGAQSLYADGLVVGVKASTLGAGVELGTSLGDSFGVRVSGNYFTYDYDDSIDGIDYNLDLNLQSFGVMLDWHPFSNGFRISAGALYNNNEIDAQADPSSSYNIGGENYLASEVGQLKGSAEFNEIAPYAGIGVDTSFDKEFGLGFLLELGVAYMGSPEIDLTANGTLAGDPNFQAELAREEQAIEDDLEEYKFYPVVTFGVTYRF